MKRMGMLALISAFAITAIAQSPPEPRATDSSLQQCYSAAESLLSRGDLATAEFQFKLFLSDALHLIANARAEAGRYPEAAPLFEKALALTPNHAAIKLDYAGSALDARDLPTARQLAQSLINAVPQDLSRPEQGKAHWILGQSLMGLDNNSGARDQFIAAVALDPSFENQYALGESYLALLDKESAARLFAGMLAHFGDSAQIHMEFGLAYAHADFPEEAIPEFKKALARDGRLPDVHYSLGASYLSRSGDTAFAEAQAEFHKELAIHPNDFFSYYELGYIAMRERHLQEAVRDLTRAAALNPQSDDTFLMLGDLYSQIGKLAEEEAALRQAIQVCTDPSKNHYQIRGAHYELGLLLIHEGKTEEGRKEMQTAESLLLQNRKLDAANLAGKPILRFPSSRKDRVTNPAAVAALKQFEQRIGPAIADSFNNMGAIEAQNQQYAAAAGYFQQAAQWNPAMDGLDYNWGRAAFGARDYHQAVICLSRYMQAHPDDNRPRVPLGMSQFMLSDYKDAADTLAPLGPALDTVPLLSYAYAESLMKTNHPGEGVSRLQRLEAADPGFDMAPAALGEIFLSRKQYQKAESQLRDALRLRPANENVRFDLALALLALNRQDEAKAMLEQLAQSGAKIPEVYYQLGKIQIGHGDANGAITSFATAASLAPNDEPIRAALASACRLNPQSEISQCKSTHVSASP